MNETDLNISEVKGDQEMGASVQDFDSRKQGIAPDNLRDIQRNSNARVKDAQPRRVPRHIL